eukprot:g5082.t1 g5082   contig18:601648-604748(-)
MKVKRDVVVDWEMQLASIIEKSNKNLLKLTSEYDAIKSKRQQQNTSYSQPLLYHPHRPSAVQQHVEQSAHNPPQPGPHQKAAIAAFHATGVKRPISRSSEDDLLRRAERIVNDKLTTTSRAIDALRDQVDILANEVRQLNKEAATKAKGIASQERRIDVLCHDFDSRREVINSIEEHMIDVADWRKSVGSEISGLKQSLVQQGRDLSTRATSSELKAGLESSELSFTTAVAPLSSILRQVNTMTGFIERDIEEKIRPIEANLIETIRDVVKIEYESLEGRFEDKLKDEVMQRLTNEIEVMKATVEPKRQKNDVSRHHLEQLLKNIVATNTQLKEELQGGLSLVRDELKQATSRYAQFVSKKEAATLLESCRNSLAEKISLLEQQLTSACSCKENDEVISSIADSILSHNSLLQSMKSEHDRMANAMQLFATKEEVVNISKQESDNFIQQLLDDRVCSEVRSDINAMKTQLESDQSTEVSSKLNAVQSLCESLSESLGIVQDLEARVESIETNFKDRLNQMQDVVEGFDLRVQSVERSNSTINPQILSELRDSMDLERFVSVIDERLQKEVKVLRSEMTNVSEKMNDIERRHSSILTDTTDRGDGIDYIQDIVFASERGGGAVAADDTCDRSLVHAIATLQMTLKDATDQASRNESSADKEGGKRDDAPAPSSSVNDLTSPPPAKLSVSASPCIHLLGLGGLGSPEPALFSPQQQPQTSALELPAPVQDDFGDGSRQSLVSSTLERLQQNEAEETETKPRRDIPRSDSAYHIGEVELDGTTPRSESAESIEGSIKSADALSLCGVYGIDDDEHNAPRSTGSPESSCIIVHHDSPRSSTSPSPVHHIDLQGDTGEDQSSAPLQTEETVSDTENELLSYLQPMPSNDDEDLGSQQQSERVDGASISDHSKASISSFIQYEESMSIPGSISSYDEVEHIPTDFVREDENKIRPSTSYNPTRKTNPEPYEGWDSLLTELIASGRILQDEASVNGGSDSSVWK